MDCRLLSVFNFVYIVKHIASISFVQSNVYLNTLYETLRINVKTDKSVSIEIDFDSDKAFLIILSRLICPTFYLKI